MRIKLNESSESDIFEELIDEIGLDSYAPSDYPDFNWLMDEIDEEYQDELEEFIEFTKFNPYTTYLLGDTDQEYEVDWSVIDKCIDHTEDFSTGNYTSCEIGYGDYKGLKVGRISDAGEGGSVASYFVSFK